MFQFRLSLIPKTPILDTSFDICSSRLVHSKQTISIDDKHITTMSFGFAVGDLITVIKLTEKVRERFVTAPSNYGNIKAEWVEPSRSELPALMHLKDEESPRSIP